MKVKVQRLNANPKYAKALEWGKLISIAGAAQIIVQSLGFLSGIMIIRMLPTDEYALFTLANTMLVTMISLADGGINSGVMSQGGKVWQNREKLGIVFATGMDLRKKIGLGSLIFTTPVLFIILIQHGANWGISLLLALALIPAFFSTLSGSLLEIVPKLHQDVSSLQKIQIITSLTRLILTFCALFLLPLAFLAVIAGGIPQILANFKIRNLAKKKIMSGLQPDSNIRNELLKVVKRILPDSLFQSISSHIPVWIITIFGSTVAVAQVGAISRLVMLIMPFSLLIGLVVVPRYARLPKNSFLLLKRYCQLFAVLLIIGLLITALIWLFSSEVCFLFGTGYKNLETEIVLAMIGNCLGLLAGTSFQICLSRGWVINPFVSILTNILAIICGILLFNPSSLYGVFMLNIFINAIMVMLHALYCLVKIKAIPKNEHYLKLV